MRFMIVVTVLLSMALIGCTGTDATEPVASLQTTETSQAPAEEQTSEVQAEEAMLDFSQCLREHGVEVGDPTMNADGSLELPPVEFEGAADADPEAMIAEMDAAFAECEEHLAGVTFGAPDPGAGVAFEDALVEYAGCMREQGIDMPDPDFSGDGGFITVGPDSPGAEDEFEAAHSECQPILAGAGLDF
ncbi:MAG: hypothetical protein HKO87_08535 [Acidimicrobiia bacterium]|nr:hypothetical protein [Acidimicrobiia bacterium]